MHNKDSKDFRSESINWNKTQNWNNSQQLIGIVKKQLIEYYILN